MKRTMVVVLLLLLLSAGESVACVGRTLYVGVTPTHSEVLLAEMISVLVNERTGTTVKILQFKDARELYGAVKKGEVGLIIESPNRASGITGKGKDLSGKAAYDLLKNEYRRSMNLVWLDPIGGSAYAAPVISVETLSNLPALPKLINKLSNIFSDETYGKVVKAAGSDEKPRKIARDFLKAKKLI